MLNVQACAASPVLSSSHCVWSGFPIPLRPHPLLWTPSSLCKFSSFNYRCPGCHAHLAAILLLWWFLCLLRSSSLIRASFWTFPTDALALHPEELSLVSSSPSPPPLWKLVLSYKGVPSSVLPQMKIRMPQGPSTRRGKVRKSFNMPIWAQIYRQKVLPSYLPPN